MAKAKKTKKKVSLVDRTGFKQNPGLFIALIALVLVGALISYQSLAKHFEKQRFEQAQTTTNLLYDDIQKNIGAPNNKESSESCRRPNLKAGPGEWSCSVGIDFVYGLETREKADQLYTKITNIVSSRSDLLKSTMTTAKLTDLHIVDKPAIVASSSYTDRKTGMKCSINYAFDTPSQTFLNLNNSTSSQKAFFVSINCYDKARRNYYGQ